MSQNLSKIFSKILLISLSLNLVLGSYYPFLGPPQVLAQEEGGCEERVIDFCVREECDPWANKVCIEEWLHPNCTVDQKPGSVVGICEGNSPEPTPPAQESTPILDQYIIGWQCGTDESGGSVIWEKYSDGYQKIEQVCEAGGWCEATNPPAGYSYDAKCVLPPSPTPIPIETPIPEEPTPTLEPPTPTPIPTPEPYNPYLIMDEESQSTAISNYKSDSEIYGEEYTQKKLAEVRAEMGAGIYDSRLADALTSAFGVGSITDIPAEVFANQGFWGSITTVSDFIDKAPNLIQNLRESGQGELGEKLEQAQKIAEDRDQIRQSAIEEESTAVSVVDKPSEASIETAAYLLNDYDRAEYEKEVSKYDWSDYEKLNYIASKLKTYNPPMYILPLKPSDPASSQSGDENYSLDENHLKIVNYDPQAAAAPVVASSEKPDIVAFGINFAKDVAIDAASLGTVAIYNWKTNNDKRKEASDQDKTELDNMYQAYCINEKGGDEAAKEACQNQTFFKTFLAPTQTQNGDPRTGGRAGVFDPQQSEYYAGGAFMPLSVAQSNRLFDEYMQQRIVEAEVFGPLTGDDVAKLEAKLRLERAMTLGYEWYRNKEFQRFNEESGDALATGISLVAILTGGTAGLIPLHGTASVLKGAGGLASKGIGKVVGKETAVQSVKSLDEIASQALRQTGKATEAEKGAILDQAQQEAAAVLSSKLKQYGEGLKTAEGRTVLVASGKFTREEIDHILKSGLIEGAEGGVVRTFADERFVEEVIAKTAANSLEARTEALGKWSDLNNVGIKKADGTWEKIKVDPTDIVRDEGGWVVLRDGRIAEIIPEQSLGQRLEQFFSPVVAIIKKGIGLEPEKITKNTAEDVSKQAAKADTLEERLLSEIERKFKAGEPLPDGPDEFKQVLKSTGQSEEEAQALTNLAMAKVRQLQDQKTVAETVSDAIQDVTGEVVTTVETGLKEGVNNVKSTYFSFLDNILNRGKKAANITEPVQKLAPGAIIKQVVNEFKGVDGLTEDAIQTRLKALGYPESAIQSEAVTLKWVIDSTNYRESLDAVREAKKEIISNISVTKEMKVNILDERGDSFIDGTDLIMTPIPRGYSSNYQWIKPEEVIGITKGASARDTNHLTIDEAENLMKTGAFDFNTRDTTWFGYRLPDGRVMISGGSHRTAAAIRQNKTFQAAISDNYEDLLSIRNDTARGEIEDRIKKGLIDGEILDPLNYPPGINPVAYPSGIVKLKSLDKLDISELFRNPDYIKELAVETNKKLLADKIEAQVIKALEGRAFSGEGLQVGLKELGYSPEELSGVTARIKSKLSPLTSDSRGKKAASSVDQTAEKKAVMTVGEALESKSSDPVLLNTVRTIEEVGVSQAAASKQIDPNWFKSYSNIYESMGIDMSKNKDIETKMTEALKSLQGKENITDKMIQDAFKKVGFGGREREVGIIKLELNPLSKEITAKLKQQPVQATQDLLKDHANDIANMAEQQLKDDAAYEKLAKEWGAEYVPFMKDKRADAFVRNIQDKEFTKNYGSSNVLSNNGFLPQGFVIKPPTGVAQEETVRLYRGVAYFSPQVAQTATLVRGGADVESVIDFVNGKITMEELMSNPKISDSVKWHAEQFATAVNETEGIYPRNQWLKKPITEYKSAQHHLILAQKGSFVEAFGPWVSTTTDPKLANSFPRGVFQGEGPSGVLVMDIPKSRATSFNDVDYENEVGVLGEIKPEWIKGFVPSQSSQNFQLALKEAEEVIASLKPGDTVGNKKILEPLIEQGQQKEAVNQAMQEALVQTKNDVSVSNTSTTPIIKRTPLEVFISNTGNIFSGWISNLQNLIGRGGGSVKGIATQGISQDPQPLLDTQTVELLTKRNLVKYKLLESGKVDLDFVQQIMDLEIIQPEVQKVDTGYILSTGKAGVVEGEVEEGKYTVTVESLAGADIQIPKMVEIKKGESLVIPVTIKKGSGKVVRMGYVRQDNTKSSKTLKEGSAKVSAAIFSENNKEVLPWAGVGIRLAKINQEKSIYLNQGWNLITLTALPDKPLTASILISEISKQGGEVSVVSGLKDGVWGSFVVTRNQYFSGDDFVIEPGKAYFIKAEKRSVFTFKGQNFVTPITLKLGLGWNTLGVPFTQEVYDASGLIDSLNTNQTQADLLSRWEFGLWDTFAKTGEEGYGENFTIENNRGYILRLDKGGEFTP